MRLLLEGFFSCLYCFCVRRESNPQRFYCARFTVWCDSTIVTADAICERNKKPARSVMTAHLGGLIQALA